jgi:hypothetical protein
MSRSLTPAVAGTDAYLELGREIVAKQHVRQAEWDAQDRVARRRGAIRP